MQGATVLDADYPLITSATLPLEVASCTAPPLVCRKLHDNTTQRLSWNKLFFNPKNNNTINYNFIKIFICHRVNWNHYPQNETIMASTPQGLLVFSVGSYMSMLVSSDQSFQRLNRDSSEERKKQHFFFSLPLLKCHLCELWDCFRSEWFRVPSHLLRDSLTYITGSFSFIEVYVPEIGWFWICRADLLMLTRPGLLRLFRLMVGEKNRQKENKRK